jgi:hypothetical protein
MSGSEAAPTFSAAEALADIRRSTADSAWLTDHRDSLRKQHPNMFIAVYNRKLVGVADAVEDMKAKLRAQGIDPEKCITELMVTEDLLWVP